MKFVKFKYRAILTKQIRKNLIRTSPKTNVTDFKRLTVKMETRKRTAGSEQISW